MYGRRIATSAQAGIQTYHIDAVLLGSFVPTHFAGLVFGFSALQVYEFGWCDQGLIIDDEFAVHLSPETIRAQGRTLLLCPDFVSVRMLVPETAIGTESVHAHVSGIAVFILAAIGTLP